VRRYYSQDVTRLFFFPPIFRFFFFFLGFTDVIYGVSRRLVADELHDTIRWFVEKLELRRVFHILDDQNASTPR
jgi:hypothetical protein